MLASGTKPSRPPSNDPTAVQPGCHFYPSWVGASWGKAVAQPCPSVLQPWATIQPGRRALSKSMPLQCVFSGAENAVRQQLHGRRNASHTSDPGGRTGDQQHNRGGERRKWVHRGRSNQSMLRWRPAAGAAPLFHSMAAGLPTTAPRHPSVSVPSIHSHSSAHCPAWGPTAAPLSLPFAWTGGGACGSALPKFRQNSKRR